MNLNVINITISSAVTEENAIRSAAVECSIILSATS